MASATSIESSIFVILVGRLSRAEGEEGIC